MRNKNDNPLPEFTWDMQESDWQQTLSTTLMKRALVCPSQRLTQVRQFPAGAPRYMRQRLMDIDWARIQVEARKRGEIEIVGSQ